MGGMVPAGVDEGVEVVDGDLVVGGRGEGGEDLFLFAATDC
jgi:hypothetical protein